MNKNLFLTGEIQVGKSTILNKTLDRIRELKPDLRLGGFRSLKVDMTIYMFSANETIDDCTEENIVCLRKGRGRMNFDARLDVFNTRGTGYLRQPADLIVMDELGFMESQAEGFQQEVLACLDRSVPVIGVVKPMDIPFLNTIRQHPDTELLTVTVETRDRDVFKALEWAKQFAKG